MGFLEQAAKSFGSQAVNKELGPSINMVGGKRNRSLNKTPQQLLNDYAGYVYKAIDYIATNGARVPIYTQQLVDGQWVRKQHPGMTTILQGTKDSPSLTWMLQGSVTYRKMFGEAFWYINVLENSRAPHDRLLLYPQRMTVIADDQGKVVGYKYATKDGQEIPLRTDECVQFKYFNPANHQRGVGPLQKAGLYVDAERNAVEYVNNFIDNNATPSGIIVLPATTADAQFDAFEIQWREKYKGKENAGKTAILQADGVDFKQISSNLKDMQLTELKDMSIKDVLAMFGVSKHMIGISDEGGLGRNSAEAHEYITNKHVIDPEIHDLVDTLNDVGEAFFANDFKGVDIETNGSWRVWYTSPIPEDDEKKLAKVRDGLEIMTLNERRALMELPPVDGGDVLVDNLGNVLTVKGLKKKATVTIRVKSKAPAEKVSIKDETVSYEAKEKYRLSIQGKQTAYERRYKTVVGKFIDEQLDQVLDDLGAKKSIKSMMDGNLSPSKQADKLTDLSIGVFLDLLQEQGDLAIKYAGGAEAFIITEDAKNYVRESLRRAHLAYNEDIVQSIGRAVSAGLTEGDSLQQIGKRITKEYEGIKGYKMNRLVRTETLKSSNEATMFGYQQLGITEKEWFNNPGACDYCKAVEDMGAQGMGDVFLEKGESLTDSEGNERAFDYESIEHPPLHPNCRCVLLPVRVG